MQHFKAMGFMWQVRVRETLHSLYCLKLFSYLVDFGWQYHHSDLDCKTLKWNFKFHWQAACVLNDWKLNLSLVVVVVRDLSLSDVDYVCFSLHSIDYWNFCIIRIWKNSCGDIKNDNCKTGMWKICSICHPSITAPQTFAKYPCEQQPVNPILWSCQIILTAINKEV